MHARVWTQSFMNRPFMFLQIGFARKRLSARVAKMILFTRVYECMCLQSVPVFEPFFTLITFPVSDSFVYGSFMNLHTIQLSEGFSAQIAHIYFGDFFICMIDNNVLLETGQVTGSFITLVTCIWAMTFVNSFFMRFQNRLLSECLPTIWMITTEGSFARMCYHVCFKTEFQCKTFAANFTDEWTDTIMHRIFMHF